MTPGTGTTQSYSYNTTHPDRLTGFNGSITYNSMGYPTKVNGYNASWTRGKLARLTKGSIRTGTNNYAYTYNAYGQRTEISYSFLAGTSGSSAVAIGSLIGYTKSFNYDNSGRLISESQISRYYGEENTSEKIVYLYDESSIIGIVYTNYAGVTSTYYFHRNLQGDVIGIYDVFGAQVGGYAYDAWGNCTITLNTNSIAAINPIRYRGYYYDSDTKLYYLNARYYNPEWRRFISPDSTAYLDPETSNGLNLYCYCGNDPVNYVDPSGNSSILGAVLLGAAIGGIVSFAFALASELIEEKFRLEGKDYLQIGVSTLIGAVEGALLVLFPGSSMLICALAGATDTAIYESIDGSSWEKVLINSAISAFLGAAAGADSIDFIRTKKVLIQATSAKKAITKGIHPNVKKTLRIANKSIVDARKYVIKSSLLSLSDDAIYEFLNFVASEYMSLIRGV